MAKMTSFIMVRMVVFLTDAVDAGRSNDRHNIISIGVLVKIIGQIHM